jgi:SanA protein
MKKKLFIYTTLVILIIATFVWWCNYKIEKESAPYLSDTIEHLQDANVGLLLGTSKYLKNGVRNYFFYYRVEAASKLYQSGKIKYILISGDNGRESYNEPQDMKDELIKSGVPDSVIYLDYAGFRTFDSVVRAKEIFGQERFIVISQKFHNERAVFIARKLGISAFGYNAQDVTSYKGFKTKFREFFARAKVYVDLAIGKQPKFLGNKIKIG